ncbi:MAG: M1 family metallopeptidase [Pyrinomonadaceae bacterium]|nr:M1 family metallopeptidase [Pyrinomonadaceae bacterium]
MRLQPSHNSDLDQATLVSDSKSDFARDFHSYSNPHQIRVNHVELELEVVFSERVLKGVAVLSFERLSLDRNCSLILDTRDLNVIKVEGSTDGLTYFATSFSLGSRDPILGSSLTIQIMDNCSYIRIEYSTHPNASALQWLDPAQTAGKIQPFMFTQSQPIHARSWIPLQDSPQVRITYNAKIRTPQNLLALMSAENQANEPGDGNYNFQMEQPVPSYLMALAVGDLAFRPLGGRTGVYAEKPVIEKAWLEFADTEKMMEVAEQLYGPYSWGRYDLLVLPPSFPWGGMENPRLTFITPTALAGDKSLVALVAHELAHSWSGNLVTNATWRDFWLNEGVTVYVERRILEEVYGREREEMEALLASENLEKILPGLEEQDRIMHIDLKGRDPDEGITRIPYDKGALFLRYLEETFGRDLFDRFLRDYFTHFAFQSITTADFINYLKENLLGKNPGLASLESVLEWIYGSGIPLNAPQPKSDAFKRVEVQADQWLQGTTPASKLETASWTTHEWLHFLRCLPQPLDVEKMLELDEAFHLTQSDNAEIAHQWLLMAIRNNYRQAYPRVEEFLLSTGRRKLISPLYQELVKTPEGKRKGIAIYSQARPTYHPVAVTTIDNILDWNGKIS